MSKKGKNKAVNKDSSDTKAATTRPGCTVAELRANQDLRYRICVLIHDLRNLKNDRSCSNRLEQTTDELYISAPYFSADEAVAIKAAIVDATITEIERDTETADETATTNSASAGKTTLAQAITSDLQNFFEKRKASADCRPCGPHDMVPVYLACFGIEKAEIEDENSSTLLSLSELRSPLCRMDLELLPSGSDIHTWIMAAAPLFAVQSGYTIEDSSQMTVAFGPTTFIISVCFKDIEGTAWGRRYLQRVRKEPLYFGDDGPVRDASDCLIARCTPLMLGLATVPSIQGLSIEAICHSPTYRLRLFSITGDVDARDLVGDDGIQITGSENCTYEPSHNLFPLPISELPASCANMPRIPASHVMLATAEGRADPREAGNVQGKVVHSAQDGSRSAMYFKPCFGRGSQFEREAQVLGRIAELGLHKEYRFSQLVGLVTTSSSDKEDQNQEMAVVGMLLHLIPTGPSGGDFLTRTVQARKDMFPQWKAEVEAMVRVLHEHDLVWGDVNAGNVIIDEKDKAWLIDFGGLNNPEFVDDELAETMKGDWQGVGRLFGVWLVNPPYQSRG
ncbi:hypothetical protein LTR17_008545 [Elasticomyces elasticus]|nr:hypothetical protein LTR17_008545 [Elasticomyces elasticus]